MTIDAADRALMLEVSSIGPRMLSYLEAIGVRSLSDLQGMEAEDLALRINIVLGKRHINRTGIAALRNLIAFANRH